MRAAPHLHSTSLVIRFSFFPRGNPKILLEEKQKKIEEKKTMKREKKLPHRGPAAMQALEPNMTMSSADRQCTLCISPRICGVGGGGKNEYVPCYFETND